MTFHHAPIHMGESPRWLCVECGSYSRGASCKACRAPRLVTEQDVEIRAEKAREERLRTHVNPRAWACLAQLERLALDDPDAGVRDRAATWLCAVLHAAEAGQEMAPEEVDFVLGRVHAHAAVTAS